MNPICRRLLPFLLLSACISATASPAGNKTAPQLARLSLIEGDVRVSRGARDEPQPGNPKQMSMLWERAEENLTLEPGFSLAVVTGRAEIAFQDGSTIYLGENSLMSFGKLSPKDAAIDLASGTLSLNVRPGAGGWYRLTTPTEQMQVKYPDHAQIRVSAYIDGMAITAFDNASVRVGKDEIHLVPDQVALLRDNKSVDAAVVQNASQQFTEWDTWVAKRIASGGAALVPAGYAIPNPDMLVPVKNTPPIFPRTVAQVSLPRIGFDARLQSFVVNLNRPVTGSQLVAGNSAPYANANRKYMGRNGMYILGGGPSAIHGGKRGAMSRGDIPWDWNNYRAFDSNTMPVIIQ